MTSSFSIWGCVLKGCFERGMFGRTRSCLKGIEDFNLEHLLLGSTDLIEASPYISKSKSEVRK